MSSGNLPCQDQREKAVNELLNGDCIEAVDILERIIEKQERMKRRYRGRDKEIISTTLRFDKSLAEKIRDVGSDFERLSLVLHLKNAGAFERMGVEFESGLGSEKRFSQADNEGVDDPVSFDEKGFLRDQVSFLQKELNRSHGDLLELRESMDQQVLGVVERVELVGGDSSVCVDAKCDTGASSCSVDRGLAERVGFEKSGSVSVDSALGAECRDTAVFDFVVGGRCFSVEASLSDRSGVSCDVLLGRDVLSGFLVDV